MFVLKPPHFSVSHYLASASDQYSPCISSTDMPYIFSPSLLARLAQARRLFGIPSCQMVGLHPQRQHCAHLGIPTQRMWQCSYSRMIFAAPPHHSVSHYASIRCCIPLLGGHFAFVVLPRRLPPLSGSRTRVGASASLSALPKLPWHETPKLCSAKLQIHYLSPVDVSHCANPSAYSTYSETTIPFVFSKSMTTSMLLRSPTDLRRLYQECRLFAKSSQPPNVSHCVHFRLHPRML